MSNDTGSTVGRAFVIASLAIATLGFGLAGLCGAVFTAIALPALGSGGGENYSAAMLVISVPSLLIGGGLAWWCVHALRKRCKAPTD
jgi:hypothetical protein